uniref:U41-Eretoxin-Ek1a_1 n=1 Tax=Eresus cinnaberinus TaxID=175337 RepID=A0A2D0PBV9_ERECI
MKLLIFAVVLFVIATSIASPTKDESPMEPQERGTFCKDFRESCVTRADCCQGQCLCNFGGGNCVCAPEGIKT